MLDISNAQYNSDGTIDCDWNHPSHGPIRFTASPDDTEAHGRQIYQWLIDGEFGEVAPYDGQSE